MGSTTRRMLAAAIAVTMLTGVAACSGDGSPEQDSTSSSSTTSGPSGETGSTGGDELDEAARATGIDPDDPPEPIASVTMAGSDAMVNGTTTTDIRLDLLGLRRDGDLLVLNMAFTPAKGKAGSYYAWTGTSWSPQIVDGQNLTVHDVAQHEDTNTAIASDTGPASPKVGGGETLYLYAVFGAPPEDVETVTVKLADGAPALTGVSIQ